MSKNSDVAVSAITAFVMGFGGAVIVVVGSGNTMNKSAWILALALGGTTAAKDVRAFLKLPPVTTTVPGNGGTSLVAKNEVKHEKINV